ncbi:hypothetical protein M8C21_014486, partial [Ambrosia artemisiifolia]
PTPPPPPPPSQHHHHAPPQYHHTQHYNHHYPPPPPHQKHNLFPNYYHHEYVEENETPTVTSLINRIAALESSLLLRRRHNHSPAPPPPPSSSLRDAAARTIQTHFRAFLVRRSATLRHLKHLASIKSALNNLKSSVSNNTHFDSLAISRESLRLLVKLDSIQGSDPMIRDGKRSISRELIRFMELIDEMCTESQVITVKNVRFGKNSKNSVINERKLLEILKKQRKYVNEVDEERFNLENPRKVGLGQIRIANLAKSQGKSQPKTKKNVSFDEDGNVYRLFKSSCNPVLSDGSGSSNGDDEEVKVEVEEIGVSSKETEVEEDESSEMSENEMDPRKNLRTRIHRTTEKKQPDQEEDDDDEDDSFVFSAPLPAKMEY